MSSKLRERNIIPTCKHFYISVYRLRDVILTDARLYLIFEYLAMDLKKYFDCLGENEDMDVELIRV